jgi:multiple sugar transport system permease protein
MKISYLTKTHLLLLPYFLGILFLVLIPAGISFSMAFFHYDGITQPRWAGTLNFILAYTDDLFLLSLRNSLALIILPAPLRVIGAFLAAYLLRGNGKFLHWLRAFVYFPTIIPTVAFSLAWLWILNPLFGPVNLFLNAFGLFTPGWFADAQWAKPALVLMSFWQIGEGFLVSVAALQDVPADLDDAAKLDGASSFQIFSKIYLPLMMPILIFLVFRDTIVALQESLATILITTMGAPYYATFTLPLFIYEKAFDLLSFGTASAAMWIMYFLTGIIVLCLYYISRQWNIDITDETSIY